MHVKTSEMMSLTKSPSNVAHNVINIAIVNLISFSEEMKSILILDMSLVAFASFTRLSLDSNTHIQNSCSPISAIFFRQCKPNFPTSQNYIGNEYQHVRKAKLWWLLPRPGGVKDSHTGKSTVSKQEINIGSNEPQLVLGPETHKPQQIQYNFFGLFSLFSQRK